MPWRAQGDNTVAGLNRYPEPQPHALVERMARLYQVPSGNVLVGRGSDEAIDLLVRAFCRAGEDSVVITPPTFGFYKVAARIQGASVVEVPLLRDSFALDLPAVLEQQGIDYRSYREEMRRASRLATISESSYIRRVPEGEPGAVQARLHVTAPAGWLDTWRGAGALELGCALESFRRLNLHTAASTSSESPSMEFPTIRMRRQSL